MYEAPGSIPGISKDHFSFQNVFKQHVLEVRGKFIQYKILHRYYWTPCRLFKIGLINSSSCWKCKKEMGTFLHLIWECPLVEPFWHSVLKFLETWAGVALPVSPQTGEPGGNPHRHGENMQTPHREDLWSLPGV
uniref:Reverse transcriptase zinc-binding domain-containing protein n=1 Tax=Pygocentrus nattereri TaxID=42514 RepID=A0AAR2K660_PYGNA